jgi:oligopeptide transport system ATP-binding protein
MTSGPLIDVRDVTRVYKAGGARITALSGVSLAVAPGETLAIVGESGSGKSTLGRIILGMEAPDLGGVLLDGRELRPPLPRAQRRRLQVVQQNPLSTLNPRRTIGQSIGLPLTVHGLAAGRAARDRVAELLDLVGLPPDTIDRYPNVLSGGQRQRAALARALAAEPDVLVLDEPTSALDVSVQARVLHLLAELRRRLGLTYIFITHDLAVVRQFAERVAVLYRGHLVEVAPTAALFAAPGHRYTTMLLASVPVVSDEEARARPEWPSFTRATSIERPSAGCQFAGRCPFALEPCWTIPPEPSPRGDRHACACHNPSALRSRESQHVV